MAHKRLAVLIAWGLFVVGACSSSGGSTQPQPAPGRTNVTGTGTGTATASKAAPAPSGNSQPSPGGGGTSTPPQGNGGSTTPSANLTWIADIQPIFRASCGLSSIGCHSAQSRSGDLTTLATAKRYPTAIRDRVNSGNMPRGARLGDTDKQKILKWVDQGMN